MASPLPRDRRSPAVLGRAALLCVLGLLWFSSAFVGGYLLGQLDAVNGRLRLNELTAWATGDRDSASRQGQAAGAGLTPEEQARFHVFWEAWGLLKREFYNRDALDEQKMTYGAIKGLVQSLDDPYTAFTTPREKEMAETALRGSFDGVGIQVDIRNEQLRVIAPIEGSPAERAGIRAGDVILAVDGRPVKGLALVDVVSLIRGPRGTTVTLTIQRGDTDPLAIVIERAEIKLRAVRGRMLEDGIGYLRIATFSATSAADTEAALRELLEQQPRGLVLDLRANPGGYLNAAVEIASQFLADGVVLYHQNADGQRQEVRARPGGLATSLPLAVLIDRGSASASEIVAAALRDNGRAVLIGEKSYGKGSVQTVHTLSDASGLRITSAIWLTPRGQPLEHQGLDPDLLVQADPTEDRPLQAAIQHLRNGAAQPAPAGV